MEARCPIAFELASLLYECSIIDMAQWLFGLRRRHLLA